MKFAMNLLVHRRVDGVCDGHRRSLVEANLSHHTLDVVLLDIHVVDEWRLHHPEVTSRKHRDERPCSARAATKASVNGCQITSWSMWLSIWPTKSRYDLLVCSVQDSCKQENKLDQRIALLSDS
jgi:hypothetical protein